MATTLNGILGGLSGRLGPVTGYRRYGIDILRSSTSNGCVKSTPKRILQQEKMKVGLRFIKAFSRTGFFNRTFPAYGHTGSGYNRALSALMNLAVVYNEDGIYIDYPMVLVSRGKLAGPLNPVAATEGTGQIHFTWTNNAGTGTAKANDKTILMAYFPVQHNVAFSFGTGTRQSEHAALNIMSAKGGIAETWIGFMNDAGSDVSCSVYTGRIAF